MTEEENPRLESDYAFLSSLGPVFKTIGEKELDAIALRSYPEVKKINHIHTLGNSSGIVDGAAAILVTNDDGLKKYGLKPRAKILATVATGEDPTIMLTGPVSASQKALKQAGLSVKDIDLWEINEAFASVVLYVKKTLGKPARVERDTDEDTILIYDGLKIRLTSHDSEPKTADLIEINSNESDLLGLTVGSTLDEVRGRLGHEVYSDENSLSYLTTYDEPIVFEHDGKRVTRITAGYEDNC